MMQTGKNAVESVKEATSNIAASAKSGMDKTKATVQEKVDKMKAQDDHEKALATEKKSERLMDAELRKQQAMSHNATQKDANTAVSEAGTRKDHVGDHELHKQHAMDHDEAEKDARAAVSKTGIPEGAFGTGANNTTTAPQYSHSSTGATGHPTGAHQMSAMPGHGTGEPTGGHVVGGTQSGSHPIGKATGTNTRSTTAQNRHAGGGTGTGYAG